MIKTTDFLTEYGFEKSKFWVRVAREAELKVTSDGIEGGSTLWWLTVIYLPIIKGFYTSPKNPSGVTDIAEVKKVKQYEKDAEKFIDSIVLDLHMSTDSFASEYYYEVFLQSVLLRILLVEDKTVD